MKRTFGAVLFALPFFALVGPSAQAQGYPSYLGCGGFCFKFLGGLHQHGPLYNYGPYSGYYPFEPYGPWNSQLQYTGPYPGNAACGGLCGLAGGCGGRVAGCGRATSTGWGRESSGCSSGSCGSSSQAWGSYAVSTFKGVFHRSHPLSNRAKISTGCSAAPASGCASCGSSAPAAMPSGGLTVSAAAAPTLQSVSGQLPDDLLSASDLRRER